MSGLTQVTTSTILIVEDDMDSADLLMLWLSELGFVCQYARNRDEALELLSRNEPASVLMNYHMPGLSLAGFLSTARGQYPHLGLVLMSGDPGLSKLGALHDIKFLLSKPFRQKDVAVALLKCLAARGNTASGND